MRLDNGPNYRLAGGIVYICESHLKRGLTPYETAAEKCALVKRM